MGFDIDIDFYKIDNGNENGNGNGNGNENDNANDNGKSTAKFIRHDDHTYLSYNWFNLREICPKHYIEEKCPCNKIHLWYFRDDCHGRRGDDVAERSQRAISQLEKLGIKIGIPDVTNSSWGWGLNNNGEHLPPKERLSVFAYHLERFRQLGLKYPDHFFTGDGCDEDHLILPDNSKVLIIKENSDSESDSQDLSIEKDRIVTYYRHPFKGTLCVNDFKSAMEIFGLLASQNNPVADHWYELAFKMPDAPCIQNE